MAKQKRPRVEVNLTELDQLVDSAQEKLLDKAECKKIKEALHVLAGQVKPDFRNSEKKDAVFPPEDSGEPKEPKKPRPGHGRNPASAYVGAEQVDVKNQDVEPGCKCPECANGRVYASLAPKPLVRVVGQMPFHATVYNLEQLRCNFCGHVVTAEEPEGIGSDKYDESVAAMIGELKYGSGFPFHRIEAIQKQAGVPLPTGVQCDIIKEAAELLEPVFEELIREAAQADVFHTDDTGMQIVEVERDPADKRTGTFTTGVVADGAGRKIAIFLTGTQHAGENFDDVLAKRAAGLAPPIHMADALNRNPPKKRLSEGVELVVANCISHGRRNFVDVAESFPDECRYVLELLGKVYQNDAQARREKLDPKQRLDLHQRLSEPLMKEFRKWCKDGLEEERVEPNSGLGKAVRYFLTHWDKLTLFLRHPGAPLDNNICEIALKKAVLHRKNSLFYRNQNGAHRGDIFMTLIYTCELSKVASFDYLVGLLRNAGAVKDNPSAWLPWNYKATLALLAEPAIV